MAVGGIRVFLGGGRGSWGSLGRGIRVSLERGDIGMSGSSKHSAFHSCRNRRLAHHEMIPENEEWLKIGEEKGGSSFKMSFQLGSSEKPNSVENICLQCL